MFFFSSRRRHTRCALVTGVQTCALPISVANARAAVAPLDAQRRVALFELAALIGETPAGVPEEALKCTHPPAPSAALPVGDGTALLRRRPDLREAERRLAADTARIGIATADLYPRISLGGSGSFLRNPDVRGSNRSEEHTSALQ